MARVLPVVIGIFIVLLLALYPAWIGVCWGVTGKFSWKPCTSFKKEDFSYLRPYGCKAYGYGCGCGCGCVGKACTAHCGCKCDKLYGEKCGCRSVPLKSYKSPTLGGYTACVCGYRSSACGYHC